MVARRGGHDAATERVPSRICSTVARFHNGIPTTSNPPTMSVDIPWAGDLLKSCDDAACHGRGIGPQPHSLAAHSTRSTSCQLAGALARVAGSYPFRQGVDWSGLRPCLGTEDGRTLERGSCVSVRRRLITARWNGYHRLRRDSTRRRRGGPKTRAYLKRDCCLNAFGFESEEKIVL